MKFMGAPSWLSLRTSASTTPNFFPHTTLPPKGPPAQRPFCSRRLPTNTLH